ncbi:chitin deacetylase [Physocladia obscura]|uniref:Chitin deacetylase n=1 Tax=Physocladia obscura TaxID=109957 RepID=A0AAD5SVM4_9FUNG|nr:chitin deacetylase [Physocladia obscura]
MHMYRLHTWSHPDLTTISDDQIVSELVYTAKAVYEVTGVFPKYFRPPYGSVDPRVRSVAATMGLQSVVFGADTGDWQYVDDTTEINEIVPAEFQSWVDQNWTNQISLEHDMYESAAQVAVTSLGILTNAGYNLMPVHQCQGDSNPYNNAILESFFLSGQFENKDTVVSQVFMTTSATTTTVTTSVITTVPVAQTGDGKLVGTANTFTSGQSSLFITLVQLEI